MIEVKNLTKKYGDRVAVGDISFEVKTGEILGFLGQNGAGKTTTMKILTGFMPATTGVAKLAGFDVFDHPEEIKRRIGYLPENPPLYTELLVQEYLEFIADLRAIPKNKRKGRIDTVLEMLHLTSVRHRLIANLSKGYRQRVGLAQALVHDPEILILDEPTIGLDPKQVSEARNLIRSMRKNKTVIYSTHILSEVAATCDHIVIIDQGKIVAKESLGQLGGQQQRTELVVDKVEDNLVSALKGVKGVSEVQASSNGTNRIIVESEANDAVMAELAKTVVGKAGLIRMSPLQHSLEEYYLNLISGKRSSL